MKNKLGEVNNMLTNYGWINFGSIPKVTNYYRMFLSRLYFFRYTTYSACTHWLIIRTDKRLNNSPLLDGTFVSALRRSCVVVGVQIILATLHRNKNPVVIHHPGGTLGKQYFLGVFLWLIKLNNFQVLNWWPDLPVMDADGCDWKKWTNNLFVFLQGCSRYDHYY